MDHIRLQLGWFKSRVRNKVVPIFWWQIGFELKLSKKNVKSVLVWAFVVACVIHSSFLPHSLHRFFQKLLKYSAWRCRSSFLLDRSGDGNDRRRHQKEHCHGREPGNSSPMATTTALQSQKPSSNGDTNAVVRMIVVSLIPPPCRRICWPIFCFCRRRGVVVVSFVNEWDGTFPIILLTTSWCYPRSPHDFSFWEPQSPVATVRMVEIDRLQVNREREPQKMKIIFSFDLNSLRRLLVSTAVSNVYGYTPFHIKRWWDRRKQQRTRKRAPCFLLKTHLRYF